MRLKCIKSSLIALTLTGTLSAGVSISCSQTSGITTYNNEVVANIDCVASVQVFFDEQPPENKVFVNLVNKSSVKLQLVANEKDFSPVNTIDVIDKVASVTIALADKQVINEKVPYGLQFTYRNSLGKTTTKELNNLFFKCIVRRDQLKDEVHIVNFNDLHATVPGYGDKDYKTSAKYPGVVRMMRDIRPILDNYPGSVLLSAGDNNSGNSFSVATHGETLFPVLKEMGVQYSAVGNHAFDWGLDYLAGERFDRWARTPTTSGKYFLASNILSNPNYKTKIWATDENNPNFQEDYLIWKNQAVRWADPYKVINMKGHRVCVIGLTTQETYNDGNQEVTKNLSFIDYNAAVHYSKYKLRLDIGDDDFNKIESFILLTHIESDEVNNIPSGGAANLASTITTDVDGIISGHSHKAVSGKLHNDYLKKDVWVGQAKSHGQKFLDTKLILDNNAPTGSKLSSINMEHKGVNIEYDGIPPDEKDDKEKVQKRDEAARKEYEELFNNPPSVKLNSLITQINTQKQILDKQFKVKLAYSEEGAEYKTQGKNLGHEYIWFDNVVEQAGAWFSKASLLGFKHLFCSGDSPSVLNAPTIFFVNQDSIAHSWEAKHDVTLKDMFDISPYDDESIYGYLNIEQIAAIIDYFLAGEKIFNYSTKPKYNGELDVCKNRNNKQLVSDDVSLNATEPTEGKTHNPSALLCGPLQFYGLRFEIEEAPEEVKKSEDRTYRLKWKKGEISGTDGNYPCIWFYDPSKSSNKFDDPETWTSALDYIQYEATGGPEKYFPVLINNFVYKGMLEANKMFARYMEYNQKRIPEFKVRTFSTINRDLVIEYCKHWQDIKPKISDTFDVTPAQTQALVTKTTEK